MSQNGYQDHFVGIFYLLPTASSPECCADLLYLRLVVVHDGFPELVTQSVSSCEGMPSLLAVFRNRNLHRSCEYLPIVLRVEPYLGSFMWPIRTSFPSHNAAVDLSGPDLLPECTNAYHRFVITPHTKPHEIIDPRRIHVGIVCSEDVVQLPRGRAFTINFFDCHASATAIHSIHFTECIGRSEVPRRTSSRRCGKTWRARTAWSCGSESGLVSLHRRQSY